VDDNLDLNHFDEDPSADGDGEPDAGPVDRDPDACAAFALISLTDASSDQLGASHVSEA
jgi:hypothetical protein